MKARFAPILLPFLLLAAACAPKEASNSGTTPPADKAPKPSETAGTTGGEKPTTTDATTPPASTAKLTDIPDSLKGDAYVYYGLGNPNPMNLEIAISDQPMPFTGTQSIALKEIKDGKPSFVIERTGQLAKLGSQELRLEPDGLYNTKATIAKIGPKDLELPMKLSPGTTWSSHAEISQDGQTIISDSVFKVSGVEKVTTKAGEHDALLITSTGQSTLEGKKAKTTSKNWYVKDLGLVKSVLVNTYTDKKVQTITLQETK